MFGLLIFIMLNSTSLEYVLPAFFAPNGIFLNVYVPHGVKKAKYGLDFSPTLITWYAALASIAEKQLLPCSF